MRGTKDGAICPHRIIDDFGIGFCLGSAMGFLGAFAKGAWHAPKREKFFGAMRLAVKRSPLFATNFALWAGIFGIGQCTLLYATGTDSIINQVISGGMAGGILNMRGGMSFFIRGASSGAVIIGMMGLGEIAMMKHNLNQQFEVKNKVVKLQQEMELRRLKEQNPAVFGKFKSMTDEEMDELKFEIEKATNEKITI